MLHLLLVSAALAQDPAESTAPPEEAEAWATEGWGWAALPAANYNSDEGVGFGAIASIFRYDGETRPYKTRLMLLTGITTKRIQTHYVDLDMLGLASGRLRLTGRAQFVYTKVENYCGLGATVTCDEAEAVQSADDLGLTGEERDNFVRNYYRFSYINPRGYLVGRYTLTEMPHRLEAFGGLRYNYFRPGDLQSGGVLAGTKYDQDFPGGGEVGHMAVGQLGLMVDNRDNEPAPNRGYWVEASGRYGTGDWTYAGFNVTLRGYVPLVGPDRLVLADRLVFDGMFGDAPSIEQNWFGGSQFYNGIGGVNAGRGIRQRRYRGMVTALNQTELRWWITRLHPRGADFDITLVGFGDLGWVQEDWGSEGRLLPGVGAGLRLTLNQNFIVRIDAGVSPIEDWTPSVYIDLNNLF